MMNKNKNGQSTIEFSLVFVLAFLFLFLTCNLFVWLNRNIVERQQAYENTRVESASARVNDNTVGNTNFYTAADLNVFAPGGKE